MSQLSSRYLTALQWTFDLYSGDVRKSTGAACLHHPLGVSELVLGAGGDEDTAIAALLHDAGEDKGGEEMLLKILAEFGERVERIVRDCSDTLPGEYTLKEPWMERKVAHIKHINHIQDDSAMVLAADTLHNARGHVRGFRDEEMDYWKNFRANVYHDRELTPEICLASTIWYLDNKLKALVLREPENPICLLEELGRTINELDMRIDKHSSFLCAEVNKYAYNTYGDLY